MAKAGKYETAQELFASMFAQAKANGPQTVEQHLHKLAKKLEGFDPNPKKKK